MAALGAQTVASSYEQLLHTDTDGGGNGNTLVTIKDGDNGTIFGLKLSTNKVEVIPSAADDANAFEVSKNDGTAVFTVNTSTVGATLGGTLTVSSSTVNDDFAIFKNTNTTAGASVPIFLSSMSGGSQTNVSIENGGAGSFVVRTGNTAISGYGTEALTIDSSQNITVAGNQNLTGDLSIGAHANGNTTGHANLNLAADANQGADSYINFNSGTTTRGHLAFDHNGTPASESMKFIIGNNLVTAMTILGSGNVGLGCTNPANKFNIQVASDHRLGFWGDTYSAIQSANDANNAYKKLRFDASEYHIMTGNVGINDTSPAQKLSIDVNSSNTTQASFDGIEIGNSNTTANNGAAISFSYGAGGNSGSRIGAIYSDRTGSSEDTDLFFATLGSGGYGEKMRITSGGAVLIGDTSQTDGELFKVHGSTDAKYLIRIHQTNTAIASDDLIMQMAFDNDATTTAGARFVVFEDSNTTMGSIAVASNVDQIVYNTTSDERLKENIKDASSQLKTINDIQVREFKWKRNGYEDIGVIAQELEKVYPKAVTKGGDDVSEKPYEVDYSTLVIPLIKAVQELSAKVEALENA